MRRKKENRVDYILLYGKKNEFYIMKNATVEQVKAECKCKDNYEKKGVTAYSLQKPIYKLDQEGNILIDASQTEEENLFFKHIGSIDELSARTRLCLLKAGFDKLVMLTGVDLKELLKIKNFGNKSLEELDAFLKKSKELYKETKP